MGFEFTEERNKLLKNMLNSLPDLKELEKDFKITVKDGKIVLSKKKKRGRKPKPLNRLDILDL
ncbi:MAG: hypothetical protein ACTSSP_02825 [Candidatus Asgardarchaeia archaeon]